MGCLRRLIFLHQPVRNASGGILFLACQKKVCKKETLGYEIALSRLKRHFVSVCHSPMARPARNALRAAVQSGFPSARYTVRVVLFAPVEYLTYGSRKAVLFARASLRITKNGLPFKSQLKQTQSISITSPVCSIRICIAFCKLKKVSAQAKPRGKSKEGGRSPLLGRFQWVCKGTGLPRESSEAIRVGKGGATERTTPVRRKRRTG